MGCPEESALKKGFVTKKNVLEWIGKFKNNDYREYVEEICERYGWLFVSAVSIAQTEPHTVRFMKVSDFISKFIQGIVFDVTICTQIL